MTAKEIFIALVIHLFVPLAGLIYFMYFIRRMKIQNTSNPSTLELFIVFATYGGLLLVTLTTFFWQWSGMASLGTFYLLLGAPIAMGVIIYKNRKIKGNSKYHLWTYKAGLWYFIIAPVTFLLLYLISNK